MAKKQVKKSFDNLITTTTDAFAASMIEQDDASGQETPKMITNRQSVYRVPLAMVMTDRYQARFTLPYSIREAFHAGEIDWAETTRRWMAMAQDDRLIKREIEELTYLGESLHDLGQIKPVTGQVISINGQDVFRLLTGERRFWATAIKTIQDEDKQEPYVLAIIDNQPTLEKQIAENMAYKALTAVGKARAAARIVLAANDVTPQADEDEFTYFRKIFEMRLSDETRQRLQDTLHLERTYYGRLMKFFELPLHLLEVCDRAEMPERVLREIMAYDSQYWEPGVMYYAERDGRTYLDVHTYMERLSGKAQTRKPRPPVDPATKSARAMRRALFAIEDIPQEDKIGALADAILGDVDQAQAHQLLGAVNELQKALAIRVKNIP